MYTGYLIVMFAGFIPLLLGAGTLKKFDGLSSPLFAIIFGVCLAFFGGINCIRVSSPQLAQRSPSELSKDAQIVQRLLRGEEAPIEHYRTILGLTLTARDELKLPPDIVKKVGDYRRYSIRFNTNDTVTVTNR